MKYYLIIVLSLIIFSCHAQKTEIRLINGYNNQPITDYKLNFINEDGKVVDSQVSDEDGVVIHKLKEPVQVAEDEEMKYLKPFSLYISSVIANKPIKYFFYPTNEAEKKILQWEKDNPGKRVPDLSLLDDVETEVGRKVVEGRSKKEDSVEEDTTDTDKSQKIIIDYPDQEASFPNGVDKMKNFLAHNIVYPEIAMELGDQGKVFIEFVVEKNGVITQVRVLRGVSREIDAESIRVVRSMPQWSPAESNGEIVRARCRIPINYILQ